MKKNGLIYETAVVDNYVIMPNHIHMVIILHSGRGRAMRAPTISRVINQFKGYATKQIGYSIWQKLFHDRIICDEDEYQKIWHYININPQIWKENCFYTK